MIFPRGKYKGRLISDIEILDPGYIRWCKENTPWMINTPNKEEIEFKNDYKQQQELQEYLRNNPRSWLEAFGEK